MTGRKGRGLSPLLGDEGLGISAPAPGGDPITLTGLPPAARALALLDLFRRSGGSVTIVVPADAEAESLARDLRGLSALAGDPDPAVILFPALESDPYGGVAAHPGVVRDRVRALWRLHQGGPAITVIPARALLLPIPPFARLAPYFTEVAEAERFARADDGAWYQEAGYRRVDLVGEPGEYARRGGILDIFPPIADQPVRIELEGDRVVSLRRFNPADQRSTGRIGKALLSPARETVLGPPERANLMSVLASAGEPARRLAEALETHGFFPGIAAFARLIYPGASTLLDRKDASGGVPLLVCDEPEMVEEQLRQEREAMAREAEEVREAEGLPGPDRLMAPPGQIESALAAAPLRLRHLDLGEAPGATIRFKASGIPSYRGRLGDLMSFIRAERAASRSVVLVMKSEGRAHRMASLLQENELSAATLEPGGAAPRPEEGGAPGEGALWLATAELGGGFTLPEARLTLVAEQEIFGEEPRHRKRSALPSFTSDFRDLNPGDLIVHVDHGVGRYEGLTRIGGGEGAEAGSEVDVMVLSYHGRDKLFVPVTRLDLVQKYSGVGGKMPSLDKLGGTGWTKTRQKVRKAMQEMAVELLNLYAARRAIEATACGPDTQWQNDFEAAFPYELTPDQANAIADIKRDMESTVPMDRLLCGDVGFGKTEVALRAAFKMVMEGRQVAVLAPTTVLVVQHARTFRERFAAFPARIETLSRFRTPKEQAAVVAGMAAGAVDLVIGTHRLLSKDVAFKDLGLLIVDEEQRFGVAHKERIKELRRNVHVLTLSATPIPRTLQMSLMGVRDLSMIETPPENRLAIQTHLLPLREPVLAAAIRHELAREGQVYLVHNRVESVWSMAGLVKSLVPEAEVGVAHGQMEAKELEAVMLRFLRGEFQVLVTTTIIENGLDIPRVNTLIVNRADRFGLSQLYQLRGRIGRSDRQAYAYLLVPDGRTLTEEARKRLKALQEFSDLGSGFRIAAMDLEIRGAGNLLGPAQHGHIAALGFELYCRMLERAVAELKSGGEEIPETRAAINLMVDLKLPDSYIGEEHHRLMFYRKIATAAAHEDLDRIREEMEDRYGRLPRQGLNLLEVAWLRMLAERLRVQSCDYRAGALLVKFAENSPVEPERILRYVSRRPDATFSPPALLRVRGDRTEADRLALAREVLTALA